jgi:pimeloyl-ACP methyl ester carboxylesterase
MGRAMQTVGGLGLAAGAGLAGVAGLAAFNQAVHIRPGELEEQLPARPTMWKWRFGNVAVYENGDRSNPPMLLLHGHNAAASAGEWRHPFRLLADRYHIFAPDLLGYGLSSRPDIPYTPDLYIEFIEDILREVVQGPAVVVVSSLTSAYAVEAASSDPDWVTALVLVCPTGVKRLTEQSSSGVVVEKVLALPVVGEGAFHGIASRPSIRYFLENQAYYNKALVTDALVDRYYRTAHVRGAWHAPAAFVSGKLYHDASDAWRTLQQGILLVWGREATITPITDAAAFLALNPRAQLAEVSPAGILPHDEQPQQFANTVLNWLDRLPR